MSKVKNSYPKTFRPSRLTRLLFVIPLVIFSAGGIPVLIGTAMTFTEIMDEAGILFALFLLLIFHLWLSMLWYMTEVIFNFAIVVTPDGLWFHGYGKRFYTWDSMTTLGKPPGWRQSSAWGICTTKAKSVHRSRIGKWMVGNWMFQDYIPIERIVRVPMKFLIMRDKRKFMTTDLGRELAHHAPHLFDDVEKPKHQENHAMMEVSSQKKKMPS